METHWSVFLGERAQATRVFGQMLPNQVLLIDKKFELALTRERERGMYESIWCTSNESIWSNVTKLTVIK